MGRALLVVTEYDKIVRSGLSILQGELDDLRRDFAAAAGEVMVSFDDMPPGSQLRRIVIANRLIRNERDEARAAAFKLRRLINEAMHMLGGLAGALSDAREVPAAVEARGRVEQLCQRLDHALRTNE